MWLWILSAVLIGLAVLLEYFSLRDPRHGIRVYVTADKELTEVDEPITLTLTAENTRRLPIPFLAVRIPLPQYLLPAEDPDTLRYYRKGIYLDLSGTLETAFSVRAGHRVTQKLVIRSTRRGFYRIGGIQISAGDFLGIRQGSFSLDAPIDLVTIPPRIRIGSMENALGGFLGDLSVQRFLFEDPVLTIGTAPYTGREPMRDISWKHSARSNGLIVKTYDHTTDDSVSVLLLCENVQEEYFERAFSLTRMLCEQLDAKHIPWDFSTNINLYSRIGPFYHMSRGTGSRHLYTLLEGLGRADRTRKEIISSILEKQIRSASYAKGYLVAATCETEELHQQLLHLKIRTGCPVAVLYADGEQICKV